MWVFALAALMAFVIPVLGPAPISQAFAQERVNKPWSLRDFLFGRKSSRVEQPDQAPARKRPAKPRRTAPRQPATPPVPIVEKLPDAKTVLVIGDFVASGVADGLNAVFASNPRVKIVDKSNGSSGFARTDYFDWTAAAEKMVAEVKPAAIVFVIGANDRQQMKVDGNREPVRSEAWTTEYTRRATGFAKALASTKIPFVWMGTPAFKSPKMNSDMLALNEIFRTIDTDLGGEFIDVWDGFVDETGAFVSTGPDINGQPVKLRAGDGINFTAAGKRKLAFYAEKPLRKILGENGTTDVAALPSAALPLGGAADNGDPSKIVRTAPISLADPGLDGGTELLGGGEAAPAPRPRSPSERLLKEGIAPDASPGRADDFTWPPRTASSALALEPVAGETTTAIAK
jgi:hypothetical protein